MDKSKLQVEEKWLKDFVEDMHPQYEEDLKNFVDSMEPEDFDNRKD